MMDKSRVTGGIGSKMNRTEETNNVVFATYSKGTYEKMARTEDRTMFWPMRLALDMSPTKKKAKASLL